MCVEEGAVAAIHPFTGRTTKLHCHTTNAVALVDAEIATVPRRDRSGGACRTDATRKHGGEASRFSRGLVDGEPRPRAPVRIVEIQPAEPLRRRLPGAVGVQRRAHPFELSLDVGFDDRDAHTRDPAPPVAAWAFGTIAWRRATASTIALVRAAP